MLSMPMRAHVATVRARATCSVCAFMSDTRSASDACCHAPTKPKSMTRAGRHSLPGLNGPEFVTCTQWPGRPVANTGGSGLMPTPMITDRHPGTSESPLFRWCTE